mmetsp:Transcript_11175/g.68903  ORF Transcript_11175/g.68903 Transcript_11175/m.68903 type:complete len:233 (+) Transcript_11175:1813-2511(+)
MPLHDPLPMVARVVGRISRFAANGSRVEEHFCSFQDQRPRSFRKPLIPTDSNPDLSNFGIEHLESGVSGIEVEFFLVPWSVRDVRFSIQSQVGTICVEHDHAVEMCLSVLFEETDGQHHVQLLRQLGEFVQERMSVDGMCKLEQVWMLGLREVRAGEEFLQEHHLCTASCCFFHHPFGSFHVSPLALLRHATMASELRGCDAHFPFHRPCEPLARRLSLVRFPLLLSRQILT